MRLSKPIHRLKDDAKRLSREAEIPLNQALNRTAKGEGFQSWSLLAAKASKQSVAPTMRAGEIQITALPLSPEDRTEFIELANDTFDMVLDRIEAENPAATRKLWDAEYYVDNLLLKEDMLPIERNYALSLIEAFLVHHVIDLAHEADG